LGCGFAGSGISVDTTYKLWTDAALGQLEQPVFQAVWKQVIEEATFPYTHLRHLGSEPSGYDPRAGFLQRWARGLAGIGTF
jgi:hypothetical protein